MATDVTGAHLVADLVLFARDTADLHVLLIQRSLDSDAFPGWWALPGGYLNEGETFEQAARREAAEESGVTSDLLRQVGIYDAPGRDPRGRIVSAAYTAVLPDMPTPQAGDDASAARWWPVDALPPLAFDHAMITAAAMSNHVRSAE